jgi:protein-S-isoprenylcysteine O-methyltransferase Ste14
MAASATADFAGKLLREGPALRAGLSCPKMQRRRMELIRTRNILTIIAAAALFLQLPVPLYWFMVHPSARIFRRYGRAALIGAALLAGGVGAAFVMMLVRRGVIAPTASLPRALTGCLLIVAELCIFRRATRELGYRRLTGLSEIGGGGEILETGIYSRLRNPRYAGSFLAVLGACLIAGTRWTWLIAAAWTAMMFGVILLEEREMSRRFGSAYEDYRRRVPRFIPALRPRLLAASMNTPANDSRRRP